MKRIALVVLLGCVGVAQAEPAEVKMLRAKVKVLQSQLANLRKTISRLRKGPAKRIDKVPQKGPVFQFEEENLEWWTDVSLFAQQLALRTALAPFYPDEAPRKWLARHDGFRGKRVTWTATQWRTKPVSRAEAMRNQASCMEELARAKKRDDPAKRKRHVATVEKRLALWKRIAEGPPCAWLTFQVGRLRVKVMILAGDKPDSDRPTMLTGRIRGLGAVEAFVDALD